MNFYDYVKEELKNGMKLEELEKLLNEAGFDYEEEIKAKKKKEEADKVKKELSGRAAEDIYKAYEAYFKIAYPNKNLPKDAKDLFMAELTFIDYMMTRTEKDYDDVLARLFKNFF